MENKPVLHAEIKRAILNVLHMLRDKPEKRLNLGICGNIKNYIKDIEFSRYIVRGNIENYIKDIEFSRYIVHCIIYELIESWPYCRSYYSEDSGVQVKSPNWPITDVHIYFQHKATKSLWDDPRRISLLNHMIKELEIDLNGK